MYYRINVSRNGTHLFATAEHSLLTKEKFVACLKTLKKKFPVAQGYEIESTRRTQENSLVSDLGDILCP